MFFLAFPECPLGSTILFLSFQQTGFVLRHTILSAGDNETAEAHTGLPPLDLRLEAAVRLSGPTATKTVLSCMGGRMGLKLTHLYVGSFD